MEDLVLLAKKLIELSAQAGLFPNLSSLSDPDREYITALLKSGPTLAQAVIEMDERVHELRATIMEQIEMDNEEQP